MEATHCSGTVRPPGLSDPRALSTCRPHSTPGCLEAACQMSPAAGLLFNECGAWCAAQPSLV